MKYRCPDNIDAYDNYEAEQERMIAIRKRRYIQERLEDYYMDEADYYIDEDIDE